MLTSMTPREELQINLNRFNNDSVEPQCSALKQSSQHENKGTYQRNAPHDDQETAKQTNPTSYRATQRQAPK